MQSPWVLCNLSACADKPGQQYNGCQRRWLLHLICAPVCDSFSFFLCVEIFKAEKNETTVACCRLSTIKCQHCKAEAGVMRPICHRLKWVCFFWSFLPFKCPIFFHYWKTKLKFLPWSRGQNAAAATATCHLRARTCILFSSLLQVETLLCQVGTLDAPHFWSLMHWEMMRNKTFCL